MLRAAALVAVFAASIAAVAACSSDDDDNGDACDIAGTYALTSSPASLTCPETGAGSVVTITASGDDRYQVSFSGVPGTCELVRTAECRTYGTCRIAPVDDAGKPTADGQMQYNWTFTGGGFTGDTYFRTDPACAQVATSIATRQ